jgi:hypothetical protein
MPVMSRTDPRMTVSRLRKSIGDRPYVPIATGCVMSGRMIDALALIVANSTIQYSSSQQFSAMMRLGMSVPGSSGAFGQD